VTLVKVVTTKVVPLVQDSDGQSSINVYALLETPIVVVPHEVKKDGMPAVVLDNVIVEVGLPCDHS